MGIGDARTGDEETVIGRDQYTSTRPISSLDNIDSISVFDRTRASTICSFVELPSASKTTLGGYPNTESNPRKSSSLVTMVNPPLLAKSHTVLSLACSKPA